MKIEVSDADIRERRAEYALALKIEKQASPTVREMWRKLVAMLDELLKRRAANRRKQFPGVAPVAPATDEPLDAVSVIAEYTSIPIEAVNRFLGALSMCGYDLVRQSSPKQLGELKEGAGGESQLEPTQDYESWYRANEMSGWTEAEYQIGKLAWNAALQLSPQRWIATSPETMPQKGKAVDLWIVGESRTVTFYDPTQKRSSTSGRTTNWQWDGQRWCCVEGLTMFLSPDVNATHWIERPTPPQP